MDTSPLTEDDIRECIRVAVPAWRGVAATQETLDDMDTHRQVRNVIAGVTSETWNDGQRRAVVAIRAKAAEIVARREAAREYPEAGLPHKTCSEHKTRFLASSYCAGCEMVRDALDALLRFVVGHPDGERWMGMSGRAGVVRLARRYGGERRETDGRGGWRVVKEQHTTADIAAMVPGVLRLLATIPGSSAARWLTASEQREYERLHAALAKAVRA